MRDPVGPTTDPTTAPTGRTFGWLVAGGQDGHALPQRVAELALAGYGVDAKTATSAAVAQGQVAEVDWPEVDLR
jgi:hypothetical protein